jgi:hypothetical protein
MTCPYNPADLKESNELVSYLKASDHNWKRFGFHKNYK